MATIPNVLSVLRLGLVPIFLILLFARQDVFALLVLGFSTLTDFLDGLIARKFNQVSRLGQLLDPAADRLFIFASLVGLSVREIIPPWFAVVVLGRELFLAFIGVVLLQHKFSPLPVHWLGKLATFCLFIALPLLLLVEALPGVSDLTAPVAWALAIWGAFLYWWAAICYLRAARVAIRSTHRGTPAASVTLKPRRVHDGHN
ncbi:MAG: CDP-alcohol phosphatidyltransferase family protein [Microbacteriaceae bacterium]|nr:CDP-alcohol phosphatidyltransferase family protein [Microbacteriaceae bacterium]